MAEKPLIVHFLNVGKGDCTIIEHPSSRISIVDINNSKVLDEDSEKEVLEKFYDSYTPLQKVLLKESLLEKYYIELTDPVDYFKAMVGKRDIFRFIATHPDMDHLSGLYRLKQEIESGNIPSILNFWDTQNNETKEGPWDKYDKRDWEEYQRLRKSESSPKSLINRRGDKNKYWNQDESGGDGDFLHILSPTPELEKIANDSDSNNTLSYVLLITYGQCSIVLGGDADKDNTWPSIHNWYNSHKVSLKIDILKASHHGRESGYYQPAVEEMNPKYTIISTGRKDEADASDLYGQYSGDVLSTRWWGNIVAVCYASGDIIILTQKNRRNSQKKHGYGWILP